VSTTAIPDRFTTLPDEAALPGRIHIVLIRQQVGF
jgi:hypothetical protein